MKISLTDEPAKSSAPAASPLGAYRLKGAKGPDGAVSVARGDVVPGLGKVTKVETRGRKGFPVTDQGTLTFSPRRWHAKAEGKDRPQ